MSEFINNITKGSEAWNIAQGYTSLKVLKPLALLDKYVTIALFGTEEIENIMFITEDVRTHLRIYAYKFLTEALLMLIENADFALASSNREIVTGYKIRLQKIKNEYSHISEIKSDDRTNTQRVEIIEEEFSKRLDELRDIKTNINTPLNDSSLIFPSSDEIDLDKLQNRLIEGG